MVHYEQLLIYDQARNRGKKFAVPCSNVPKSLQTFDKMYGTAHCFCDFGVDSIVKFGRYDEYNDFLEYTRRLEKHLVWCICQLKGSTILLELKFSGNQWHKKSSSLQVHTKNQREMFGSHFLCEPLMWNALPKWVFPNRYKIGFLEVKIESISFRQVCFIVDRFIDHHLARWRSTQFIILVKISNPDCYFLLYTFQFLVS